MNDKAKIIAANHVPSRVTVASGAGRIVCSCGWQSDVEDDGFTQTDLPCPPGFTKDAQTQYVLHVKDVAALMPTPALPPDHAVRYFIIQVKRELSGKDGAFVLFMCQGAEYFTDLACKDGLAGCFGDKGRTLRINHEYTLFRDAILAVKETTRDAYTYIVDHMAGGQLIAWTPLEWVAGRTEPGV